MNYFTAVCARGNDGDERFYLRAAIAHSEDSMIVPYLECPVDDDHGCNHCIEDKSGKNVHAF